MTRCGASPPDAVDPGEVLPAALLVLGDELGRHDPLERLVRWCWSPTRLLVVSTALPRKFGAAAEYALARSNSVVASGESGTSARTSQKTR
jgi:hypothetical protein